MTSERECPCDDCLNFYDGSTCLDEGYVCPAYEKYDQLLEIVKRFHELMNASVLVTEFTWLNRRHCWHFMRFQRALFRQVCAIKLNGLLVKAGFVSDDEENHER